MNRKQLGLVSVIILLLTTSCLKDVEMKTARSGNEFLIDIPKTMAESTTLKPGADLQFSGDKNFPLHFYAVTDEKADQKTMGINFTAEEIYFLEAEEIGLAGQNVRVGLPKQAPIQYLNCLRGDVFMNANGGEQHFRVCVCEGGNRFYRLVIFGETAAMAENKKMVEQIFESFREWTEFQAETGKEG